MSELNSSHPLAPDSGPFREPSDRRAFVGLMTTGLGLMATGARAATDAGSAGGRAARGGAAEAGTAGGEGMRVGSASKQSESSGPVANGSAASAVLGPPVRLTRERLDAWAGEFFPAFNQAGLLPAFSAARLGARHDVALRTVTTFTRIPETGERVAVTGLLAVPESVKGRIPLVSWQHGTILSRDQVPSNLVRLGNAGYKPSDAGDSLETLFILHRMAGQGFAVVAADYLGKGDLRGERGEAYGVKEATVATCCDILEAGLAGLDQLGLQSSALFLNGWSQGGANTQWVHQALRRRGVSITASAAQSPFNNLVEVLRYWTGRLSVPDQATYPEYRRCAGHPTV